MGEKPIEEQNHRSKSDSKKSDSGLMWLYKAWWGLPFSIGKNIFPLALSSAKSIIQNFTYIVSENAEKEKSMFSF